MLGRRLRAPAITLAGVQDGLSQTLASAWNRHWACACGAPRLAPATHCPRACGRSWLGRAPGSAPRTLRARPETLSQ
eukprot:8968987-Pyramimonas_sp.AAC.1